MSGVEKGRGGFWRSCGKKGHCTKTLKELMKTLQKEVRQMWFTKYQNGIFYDAGYTAKL